MNIMTRALIIQVLAILSTLNYAVAFSTCQKPYIASHFTSVNLIGSSDDNEIPRKKGFIQNFFEELDAFVDDATSRRLGNGAQYYGKRKSSFYGKEDVNRKRDKSISDPTEDYRGPSTAGYFKWMPDQETGELKPVTRLKEVNIEKKIAIK